MSFVSVVTNRTNISTTVRRDLLLGEVRISACARGRPAAARPVQHLVVLVQLDLLLLQLLLLQKLLLLHRSHLLARLPDGKI